MNTSITPNTLMTDEKSRIIDAFDNGTGNHWKTLLEIASETTVALEHVIKIVFSSDEFVESSYPAEDGQPRFSTLKAFRKNASFYEKVRGALNFRID
jgi:hypothetical protein